MKTKKTTNDRKQNFNGRLTCLVVGVLIGISSTSLGAGDTWTQKADMPTARSCLSASTVDGKIYAIGGHGGRRNVEEYDPATDTWTKKANMPTWRQWLSASVVNGKIYVIGGTPHSYQPALSIVEEYDPATDTWTEKAPMPTARFTLSTSTVDGKIYAIGGILRSTQSGPETPSSAVEEYDPETDTWTTKAPMPTARGMLTTSVVDGKIYAIGGLLYNMGKTFSTVEVYDPATDTWTEKTPMPTARATPCASAVDGIICVIGGGYGETAFSTVEAYNPATDTWTEKTSMPEVRTGLATSVVNGKIYAIGGRSSSHGANISTVYEYESIFIPADFYRDGIVDIEDLLILIENWGRNEPSVDIAPLPFGDGVVDALDLEVLMSYWEQRAEDVTAHWALDETQGFVAHDSIGNNNGTLHGGPLWQPLGGKLGGALEFQGIDDYISTPFVLNPMKGSFSVFAWIKGGSSGQVIISQMDTTDGRKINPGSAWLGANLSDGRLMTGFCGVYFDPLESEAVITDGQWHHVGLVYDLDVFHRRLYVDGILVAEDTTAVAGSPSDGGLYIGASKDFEAGSFFSGLIDDVRIYKRAVRP
ncbi:MAG: Kelch repeat-containing protein [Planctomycetota bacterium]